MKNLVGSLLITYVLFSACSRKNGEQLFSEGTQLQSAGSIEKARQTLTESCEKGSWRGCRASTLFSKTCDENNWKRCQDAWYAGKNEDEHTYLKKFIDASEEACVRSKPDLEACDAAIAAFKVFTENSLTVGEVFGIVCENRNDYSPCMAAADAYLYELKVRPTSDQKQIDRVHRIANGFIDRGCKLGAPDKVCQSKRAISSK